MGETSSPNRRNDTDAELLHILEDAKKDMELLLKRAGGIPTPGFELALYNINSSILALQHQLCHS